MAPRFFAARAASLLLLTTAIHAMPNHPPNEYESSMGDSYDKPYGKEYDNKDYDSYNGAPSEPGYAPNKSNNPPSGKPEPAELSVPYLGCFLDNGNPRVLPSDLLASDDMTAAKCEAHCKKYSYFGVEYGRECWCGNSPPYIPVPEHECSMPCSGGKKTACGAHHRTNVWGKPLPSPEYVADYRYQGCFTDRRDQHSLTGKVTRDKDMTLELCAYECKGYAFFGVEYGTQCFCGTKLEASARRKPQAECSMRCGGDYYNVCGDADRLNVYSTGSGETGHNLEKVNGYKFKGCWTDSTAVRSLAGKVHRSNDMTVELCSKFCKGHDYFGLEYASQCFCGKHLGGYAAPEGECSELCAGNKKEWCGGPDRLSVYAGEEVCKEEAYQGEW